MPAAPSQLDGVPDRATGRRAAATAERDGYDVNSNWRTSASTIRSRTRFTRIGIGRFHAGVRLAVGPVSRPTLPRGRQTGDTGLADRPSSLARAPSRHRAGLHSGGCSRRRGPAGIPSGRPQEGANRLAERRPPPLVRPCGASRSRFAWPGTRALVHSRTDSLKVPARKPLPSSVLNSRPPTFRKWVPSWSAVKTKRVLPLSPPP